MKFLLPLLLLFATNVIAQKKTDLEMGFSSFLAGDTKTAHRYLTKVIATDTSLYEAYYFRGIISLWENDTLVTIKDFDHALQLKLAGTKPGKDDILKNMMQYKPEQPSSICSLSADPDLIVLQQGTWYLLSEKNYEKSCNLFKTVAMNIKPALILTKRVCR